MNVFDKELRKRVDDAHEIERSHSISLRVCLIPQKIGANDTVEVE